jgi:O-antigen ligase
MAAGNPARTNGVLRAAMHFPRMDIREGLLVLIIWSTYLLPVDVKGVIVAHAFLLTLIAICWMDGCHRRLPHTNTAFFLFFAILSLSSLSALYFGLPVRFPNETVKLILLFLGTFFIGLSFRAERLRAILAPAPWLSLVMMLIVLVFIGPLFSLSGRLDAGGFVSPNVLGYFFVLNMAVVWARPKWKAWDWLVFVLLGISMLACLSRGSMIAAVAVFALHFGIGRTTLLAGGVAGALAAIFSSNPVVQRMLILGDVATSGGSGRTEIWGYALSHWLNHPLAWLSGFGPGSIHLHIRWGSTQDAAHSMYIGALHYTGLLGLAFLLVALGVGFMRIMHARPSPERTLARDFLVITIVNGLVDETYLASQATAISAICFGLIVAVALQLHSSPEQNMGPRLSISN